MKADYQFKSATQATVITQPQKKRFNLTNILFAFGALGVFASSSFVIGSSVVKELSTLSLGEQSFFGYEQQDFHKTSIPWLQNQADCEHTGREWSDGKCWDAEHDPSF